MALSSCPFCTLPRERVLGENAHALWIRDGFPFSPGHSFVIPKRHTGSFFDTSDAERQALLALLDEARAAAEAELAPASFNIGINDVLIARQTVASAYSPDPVLRR